MNTKRKPIKPDHNLANSWKAAGEQHTENYQLFKKELKNFFSLPVIHIY